MIRKKPGQGAQPGADQGQVAAVHSQDLAGGKQPEAQDLVPGQRGHQQVPGRDEHHEQEPGEPVAGLVAQREPPRGAELGERWRRAGSRGVAGVAARSVAGMALIGLQLPALIRALSHAGAWPAEALAIAGTLIATRILWVFPLSAVLQRRAGTRRPSWPVPAVVSWAGTRGVVPLAAGLSIPLTTASGAPLPERDLILVLATTVIVVSLIVQGLTLEPLARFAGIARRHAAPRGNPRPAAAGRGGPGPALRRRHHQRSDPPAAAARPRPGGHPAQRRATLTPPGPAALRRGPRRHPLTGRRTAPLPDRGPAWRGTVPERAHRLRARPRFCRAVVVPRVRSLIRVRCRGPAREEEAAVDQQ